MQSSVMMSRAREQIEVGASLISSVPREGTASPRSSLEPQVIHPATRSCALLQPLLAKMSSAGGRCRLLRGARLQEGWDQSRGEDARALVRPVMNMPAQSQGQNHTECATMSGEFRQRQRFGPRRSIHNR